MNPKRRCPACETVEGCERHQIFTCINCCQPTPWADGGADGMPWSCSACWLELHPRPTEETA